MTSIAKRVRLWGLGRREPFTVAEAAEALDIPVRDVQEKLAQASGALNGIESVKRMKGYYRVTRLCRGDE